MSKNDYIYSYVERKLVAIPLIQKGRKRKNNGNNNLNLDDLFKNEFLLYPIEEFQKDYLRETLYTIVQDTEYLD